MASLREVGQRLKQAREAQGLSLEEVAGRTRITVRHLLALEEGNETDLPEVFYIRGFLKKYAEAVGLAPNDVADAYRAAPIPTATTPDIRPGLGPIVQYVVIAALLVGAFAAAWYSQPRVSVVEDPNATATPAAASPSPATPSPAAVVASPSVAPSPSAGASASPEASPSPATSTSPEASPAARPDASPSPAATSPSPATSPSAAARPTASPKPSPAAKPTATPKPTPTPKPSPTAKPTPKATPTPRPSATVAPLPSAAATPAALPGETTTPAASPAATPTPRPRPSAKPSPAAAKTVTVRLDFVERSWVEVIVDGRLTFEGILSKGSQRQFKGKAIEVSAGNSGGVRITANGKDMGRMGPHAVVTTRTYRP